MGLDLGGVVNMPTDSCPNAETVMDGTTSTSHVFGTAIATPPGDESPVFLSDRITEKPGRENSISPCSLVSFSIRTIASYVCLRLSIKCIKLAFLFLTLLTLIVMIAASV